LNLVLRLLLAFVIALGGVLPSGVTIAVAASHESGTTRAMPVDDAASTIAIAEPCHGTAAKPISGKPVDRSHCVTLAGSCCALELPSATTTAPAFAALPVEWLAHADVAIVAWAREPATPPPRI
jgi:hypothetical protein